MNYPYGMWGPQMGMGANQPIVFIPSPGTPPNTPTPNFTSWQDVHRHAKQEMKREAKLKRKWDEEAKKKKPPEIKRASIPIAEGLFLAVLISPFIGLPTLKLYQMIFQMWGSALGVK